MISFKKLELKNFLSVGDNPITLYLDRSPTTLITGSNGVGKSAIIADGISFPLFGKSFRGINKPALVNTVNQRDSWAKITFNVGSSEYTILRGQKPARLEITKDGKVLNEDAAVADTQSYIESDVLGFDFNTFIRVCILSTMNYIPFMQLSAYERRNFVENMLSLKTFTDMNKIHKANMSTVKDKITGLERDIQVNKTSYTEKRKTLDMLNQIDEDRVNRLKTEVAQLVHRLQELYDDIEVQSNQITIIESENVDDAIASLKTKISKTKKAIREHEVGYEFNERQSLFFSNNSVCEQCLQDIEHDHAQTVKIKLTAVMTNHLLGKTDQTAVLERYVDELQKLTDRKDELTTLILKRDQLQSSRKIMATEIKNKVAEIETKPNGSSNTLHDELAVLKSKLKELARKFDELQDRLEVGSIVTDLLKDTGIKGSIIKQYIPLLVGYVNMYLEKLNISIKFSMDENFNESITTRYANEYTYANLSAGERARIDLAIAFAWRQIARIKGSAYTNLLVLDEVADASLDVNGTEDLMSILEEITADTNVFIVSHKANLDEHVRSVLKLEKHNGFTKIVQN